MVIDGAHKIALYFWVWFDRNNIDLSCICNNHKLHG